MHYVRLLWLIAAHVSSCLCVPPLTELVASHLADRLLAHPTKHEIQRITDGTLPEELIGLIRDTIISRALVLLTHVTGSLINPQCIYDGPDLVLAVAFNADMTKLYACFEDSAVCSYDLESGECEQLAPSSAQALTASFSPHSVYAATGHENGSINLCDTRTKQCYKLHAHTSAVEACAFNELDTKLISGSWDESLCLWDLTTKKLLRTYTGHTDLVRAVAFGAHEGQAFSTSNDHTTRQWDMLSGQAQEFAYTSPIISDLKFCSYNKSLLTISWDDRCFMRRITAGQATELRGPPEGMLALALSPNNRCLATGSYDNTIRLWDIHSLQSVTLIPAHIRSPLALAWSSDGTTLASAGFDNRIYIWPLTEYLRTLTIPMLLLIIQLKLQGLAWVAGDSYYNTLLHTADYNLKKILSYYCKRCIPVSKLYV